MDVPTQRSFSIFQFAFLTDIKTDLEKRKWSEGPPITENQTTFRYAFIERTLEYRIYWDSQNNYRLHPPTRFYQLSELHDGDAE